MAVRIGARAEEAPNLVEIEDAVEREYRARLAAPAVLPWARTPEFTPEVIGNTWRVDPDTGLFVLPELSLGWDLLRWAGARLVLGGRPYRATLEQARFMLWQYAIDDSTGDYCYRKVVLQRLKGWGKDPTLAVEALFEVDGTPVPWDVVDTPAGWGRPDARRVIGADNPQAWVQLAAVSKDQTKNTTLMLPSLMPRAYQTANGIVLGMERSRVVGTSKFIDAVTKSPTTLEGGRGTLIGLNEPHLWVSTNAGHAMSDVIDRNMTKISESRSIAVTNAYNPGEDSVGERLREAHLAVEAGEFRDFGLYYDSIEAPPTATMEYDKIIPWLEVVRGDSTWLNATRLRAAIVDPTNAPSTSRRFYYNSVVTREDKWLSRSAIKALVAVDGEPLLSNGDRLFVFFDGSKSLDSTALVGCRLEDGAVFQLGVWARPAGLGRKHAWEVDRAAVIARVAEVMDTYRVLGLWADPSDSRDEEEERYWSPIIDEWHRQYASRLKLWSAPKSGARTHAVSWDMREGANAKVFIRACMTFAEDVDARRFFIGREVALQRHLGNAQRRPSKLGGVGIGKESASSSKKIDLAVCAVAARMMRSMFMNARVGEKAGRGKVW